MKKINQKMVKTERSTNEGLLAKTTSDEFILNLGLLCDAL